MREIELKTNLDVILFDFVDSLSKWDYFIAGHILEYYHTAYGVSDQNEIYLEAYRKFRKELGWSAQADLLKWAFDGFDKDSKFSELLSTINHFKKKKDLLVELKEGLISIESVKDLVKDYYDKNDVKTLIRKFKNVFKPESKEGILPAYLLYSPWEDRTQGGANGEGIYSQVPKRDDGKEISYAGLTIFHEYLHKELNPGGLFQKHRNTDGFYSTIIKEIYPDPIWAFTEEVIVHSLCNVITFGKDPDKLIDNYRRQKDREGNHFIALWKAIKEVAPILKQFLENEIREEELVENLDNFFRSLM